MCVYLIHFTKSFKHAKHYIGYTATIETLRSRIYHHKRGSGSRLLRAVSKANINWYVSRIWENEDGNFERKLKNGKNSKKLCPVCNSKIKNLHPKLSIK